MPNDIGKVRLVRDAELLEINKQLLDALIDCVNVLNDFTNQHPVFVRKKADAAIALAKQVLNPPVSALSAYRSLTALRIP
jgi:hypothetical protein